jgi:cytochrome c oxidase cbb3-type subunit IV
VTYNLARELADTFGLVLLFFIFLVAIWRALRPSARPHHESAAMIPLRDEDPSNG